MLRLTKAFFLAATLILALAVGVLVFVGESEAHPNDDWAVVNDELHYTSVSKYQQEIDQAAWRWQRFDCYWDASPTSVPCSGVNVAAIEGGNLRFNDTNDCNTGYLGVYRSAPSPDQIELNACRLDDYPYGQREMVASHEIGHALKLQHTPCTQYYIDHSVMVPGTCGEVAPRRFQPAYHDRRDYYYLWVYYDDH